MNVLKVHTDSKWLLPVYRSTSGSLQGSIRSIPDSAPASSDPCARLGGIYEEYAILDKAYRLLPYTLEHPFDFEAVCTPTRIVTIRTGSVLVFQVDKRFEIRLMDSEALKILKNPNKYLMEDGESYLLKLTFKKTGSAVYCYLLE